MNRDELETAWSVIAQTNEDGNFKIEKKGAEWKVDLHLIHGRVTCPLHHETHGAGALWASGFGFLVAALTRSI